MINLPNPFESALEPVQAGADDGHWPATADPADPVAVSFLESSPARGGQEAPAEATQNPATAGPLPDDLSLAQLVARGFDVDGFMNDIEPLPAFISNPSPEYLRANDLMPVLAVLAGH